MPPELDRLSDEEPEGDVPFVTRGGPIVVGDRRILPDLPGIRQIVNERVKQGTLADVGRVFVLAALRFSRNSSGK
jgi:hypothetical protein